MNWQLVAGLFNLLLGFTLTIIAMATNGWIQSDQNGTTCNVGLTKYTCCKDDNCTTKDNDGDVKTGGQKVMQAAIPALFVAFCSAICLYLSIRKMNATWRIGALFGFIIAGALTLLAVILYSKATIHLDYGFIVYLFCAFSLLAGATTVVTGPGVTPQ